MPVLFKGSRQIDTESSQSLYAQAPLTRPELINPIVREFLDTGSH